MTEGKLRRSFGPTRAALRLLLFATALNLLGLAARPLLLVALLLDAAWVAAFAIDAARLRSSRLQGERRLPDVLLAFTPNAIEVELFNPTARAQFGRWLDTPPLGVEAPRARQVFALEAGQRQVFIYALPSPPRGRLVFGDLHAEVEGPWGLAASAMSIPAQAAGRCLPVLTEPDAGDLHATAHRESGRVRLRRLMEGREFDNLREYRVGDDRRLIDWKATARRGEPIVREYAPERNQAVVLMIDCGRHLVAREHGRTKLDHSLQAALRLGRACLAKGDAVGLIAFGSTVRAWVSPAKGAGQLKALIDATFELQPELEESDYRAAFDLVQQRVTRRALICIFSELGDEDTSRLLLSRVVALRPRHLPVLITLDDSELAQLVRDPPLETSAAYARAAAVRLERERQRASARVRGGGVTLVRASAENLSLATLDAYLGIKARGLL